MVSVFESFVIEIKNDNKIMGNISVVDLVSTKFGFILCSSTGHKKLS